MFNKGDKIIYEDDRCDRTGLRRGTFIEELSYGLYKIRSTNGKEFIINLDKIRNR